MKYAFFVGSHVRHRVKGVVLNAADQFACDGGHDRLDLFALLEHSVILPTETFLSRLSARFRIVRGIDGCARQLLRVLRRETIRRGVLRQ